MAKKLSRRKVSPHSSASPNAQRLNKILAAAGLGSRRKVEELIEQGRVEIDGDIVTDLACKVEPAEVKIKVDGQLLKKSRPVYFALNKPPGVLSTNYDPSGRMRVIDLVPDRDRVFSVGRLDQSSEGLMLLTNDGELAQRLAHPKFRIQKSYFVVVSGQMTEEELVKLRKGVHLAEGYARIDGATIKRVRKGCTEIEIVLSEGKNREIRRILARAGHKVVLLRRIAIGPLRLGQMPVGASRILTSAEVKALYVASDPDKRPKRVSGQTSGKPGAKSSSSANASSTKSASQSAAPKVKPPHIDDEDDDDLLSLALQLSGDDVDDDFVGDFSGGGATGSVLGFDDESPVKLDSSRPKRQPTKRSPRGEMSPRGRGGRGAVAGSSAEERESTGAPRQPKRMVKKGRPRSSDSSSSPARGYTERKAAPKSRSASPRTSGKPSSGKGQGGRGGAAAAPARSSRGAPAAARGRKASSPKRGKR